MAGGKKKVSQAGGLRPVTPGGRSVRAPMAVIVPHKRVSKRASLAVYPHTTQGNLYSWNREHALNSAGVRMNAVNTINAGFTRRDHGHTVASDGHDSPTHHGHAEAELGALLTILDRDGKAEGVGSEHVSVVMGGSMPLGQSQSSAADAIAARKAQSQGTAAGFHNVAVYNGFSVDLHSGVKPNIFPVASLRSGTAGMKSPFKGQRTRNSALQKASLRASIRAEAAAQGAPARASQRRSQI